MAALLLHKRLWDAQPTVGTRLAEAPLTRGLFYAATPAEDLVYPPGYLGTTQGAQPVQDRGGRYGLFRALRSHKNVFAFPSNSLPGDDLTFVAVIERSKTSQADSAGSAYACLRSSSFIGNYPTGLTSPGYANTLKIAANVRQKGGAAIICEHVEAAGSGSVLQVVIARFTAYEELALFVNGDKKSSVAATNTWDKGFYNRISTPGNDNAGPAQYGNVGSYLSLLYNRALSDVEIQALTQNPWAVFRPRRRSIYVDLGASGGSTLNAAASGQSQASGTAQLAAQVALAGIGVAIAGGQAAAAVAVPLAAAGIAVAGGQANARATVAITAAGLAQAAGQAGLSAAVLAQAAGAAQAAGNAQLAAQLQALASGAAQASGAANLSGGAPGVLSAAGTAEASGAAVLTVTVNLAATGNAQAGGSAQAGARVDGQAAGAAQAGGSATLTGGAPGMLAAAGNAVAGGWASWSVMVNVTAAGFVQAMGAGQLSIEVPLAASGQAIAGGQATGALLGETRHYRLKADCQRITRLASRVQRLTTITHEVRHVG